MKQEGGSIFNVSDSMQIVVAQKKDAVTFPRIFSIKEFVRGFSNPSSAGCPPPQPLELDSAIEGVSGILSLFEVSWQGMDQTPPEFSSSLFPSFSKEVLLVGSIVEAGE